MQTRGKVRPRGTAGSNPKPFLSQDVFRLVARLEAQKVLGDVDIGALEHKFCVPLGYSEEDTHRKQEKLDVENLPGPGAYEVEDPWKPDVLTLKHPSAIFASRTDRGPFQLASSVRISDSTSSSTTMPSSKAPNHSANNNNNNNNEFHSPTRVLDTHHHPPPPLGSFSRSTRGLEPATSATRRTRTRQQQAPEFVPLNEDEQDDEEEASRPLLQSSPPVRSLLSTQSAVFPRVSKDKTSFIPVSTTDPDLGPGICDVQRFWDAKSPVDLDAPHQHHRPVSRQDILGDSPTSAAFGASREKREVLWSPARNPPSYAIPEAWNASPHYARQKTKVLHAVEKDKERRERQKQQLVTIKMNRGLESSESTPGLSSLKHATKFPATASTGTGSNTNESLDPFEWLRRQPQGEHRVNLLATKYGLLEQVKIPQHHSQAELTSLQQPLVCDKVAGEKRPALAHQGSLQTLQQQQQQPNNNDSNGDQGDQGTSSDLQQRNERDERIVISCRLPGGMMLSATLFSRKKVRHLKASIVQKSHKRFANDEQFDLYLPNGRKLSHLEDTLHACGLTTRSLVQIAPATTTPAATGSPLTSKHASALTMQE